ncbi:MAG: hypothetical protein K2W88_06460 [Pararheinheimera sp.]|nr:hypothetical protein [Rheinheimera sp.]
MTWIHIIAGLVAIFAGAVAMIAAKGSPLHRKSGTVFTISMLVMTGSAAIVSLFLRTDHVTGVVALVTAYLVCTSWLVVKRKVQDSYWVLAGFALAAAILGVYSLTLWFNFLDDPKSLITRNSPPQTLMVFGAISLLCAALDVRLLRAGQIIGAQRLVRHLWRMCFAMLIATGSFFAGQMQVFPAMVQKSALFGIPILLLPVLLVILTTLYWLGRTLLKPKRVVVR